jgi:tRNA(Arg) A34 adenosine deaminase TadA
VRDVYLAFLENRVIVPTGKFQKKTVVNTKKGLQLQDSGAIDMHAERRIHYQLTVKEGKRFDETCLGGVKRPCAVCAMALQIKNSTRGFLFCDGTADILIGEDPIVISSKKLKDVGLKAEEVIMEVTDEDGSLYFRSGRYRGEEVALSGGLSYVTMDAPASGGGYDTDSDDEE